MEYFVYYGCVIVAGFTFQKDAKKFLKKKRRKALAENQTKYTLRTSAGACL